MQLKTAIFLIILITIFSTQALAQEEINLLDPGYNWRSPNLETKIEFADSGLTISSTNSSTGIYNLRPLNASIQKFDLLIIEMKTSKDGIGEISWSCEKAAFTKKRSYPFYVKRTAAFKTYFVDLGPRAESKDINHLLFFPFSGPGKSELKSFKLVQSSFREKLLAAWQEFWGPQGRERAGDTFLIIRPVMLFGRSIFVYLNWLIGLMIVIALIKKRPGLAIGTILVLWSLLEVSSLVNNWHFFKADQKFWGKPLEEKRTMQNYKDFYPFMKHAQKIIPECSSFVLITHPKYRFSQRRAQYYLYPRPWSEKDPLYVLLFKKGPNQQLLLNHRIISEFKPGAYILKRKNYDN